MRFTYDPDADAAMIFPADDLRPNSVARNEVADMEMDRGAVVFSFDLDDRLVSIEVLGASKLLPPSLLQGPAPRS